MSMTDPIHSEIPDAAVEAGIAEGMRWQEGFTSKGPRYFVYRDEEVVSEHPDRADMEAALSAAQTRAIIAAAFPHLSPPVCADRAGVVVKPLEWVKDGVAWHAHAIVGRYTAIDHIQTKFASLTAEWWGPEPTNVFSKAESLNDAKAAAQADYEKRILSAIALAPALPSAREERLAKALRKIAESDFVTDGWVKSHALEALDFNALIEPALASPAVAEEAEPVALTIVYTNWRGETAERSIMPVRMWFGSTEWHPEPQWLLRAIDTEKGAERDFAWNGIDFQGDGPAVTHPRPTPAAAVIEAAKAGWNACRKSIYAVCEDVQEKASHANVNLAGSDTEKAHERGYYRGQAQAAKSIARGFNALEASDDDNFQAALSALASNAQGGQG